MNATLFAFSGVAAGALEAHLLARAARQRPHPLSFSIRLGLVTAGLLIAARAGHVLSGAAGFMLGFLVACVVAYRRLR